MSPSMSFQCSYVTKFNSIKLQCLHQYDCVYIVQSQGTHYAIITFLFLQGFFFLTPRISSCLIFHLLAFLCSRHQFIPQFSESTIQLFPVWPTLITSLFFFFPLGGLFSGAPVILLQLALAAFSRLYLQWPSWDLAFLDYVFISLVSSLSFWWDTYSKCFLRKREWDVNFLSPASLKMALFYPHTWLMFWLGLDFQVGAHPPSAVLRNCSIVFQLSVLVLRRPVPAEFLILYSDLFSL